MSLTVKEWAKLWESIKRIERYNNSVVQNNASKRININMEVAKMKAIIEQVTGQME